MNLCVHSRECDAHNTKSSPVVSFHSHVLAGELYEMNDPIIMSKRRDAPCERHILEAIILLSARPISTKPRRMEEPEFTLSIGKCVG
jgi:hypothetical protein